MSADTSSPGLCAFCLDPCTLTCANCKKVSYCSKNHQKFDRRAHKPICHPVKVEWTQTLGHHLVATRDISCGEVIWTEKPIVVGPRSNLAKAAQVCLGCCNLVSPTEPHSCPVCQWPMCGSKCHQNPWHQDYECKIFESNQVGRPSSEDEFLFVTILRCVLMKSKNETLWNKFSKFEFHRESIRRQPQGLDKILGATNFILGRCKLLDVGVEEIEKIYGMLTVNGYSDASKFYVKLYELGSKISHSCLPNTRSMAQTSSETDEVTTNVDSKLIVVSTLGIAAGSVLTQLYGSLLTGTHRRQELLQNIYWFTCSCSRCQDPSELQTNFSGILCQTKKCRRQGKFVLPEKPLDLSSSWTCPECRKKWNYNTLVFPALRQVAESTQMTVDDPLFSELEFYSSDGDKLPMDSPELLSIKSDYIIKMDATIDRLGKDVIHPNHYSLLPIKTAMIATIHTIIDTPDQVCSNESVWTHKDQAELARIFLKLATNVFFIFDKLTPGMTRNRGIILFYLSRGLKMKRHYESLSASEHTKIMEYGKEAEQILKLEPKCDEFRQLLETFAK